jgi:DNA-binding transcriptional MocR family regulator
MTNWRPDLTGADSPLYHAIALALVRDIESGVVPAGTRLPTHRALARRLNVNVGTITRAYAEVARRGLIDGEVGRGSYVRDPMARSARAAAPLSVPAGMLDLAFNLPSGGPTAEEHAAALRALAQSRQVLESSGGYHIAGTRAQRDSAAKWLARCGMAVDSERVLVTGGAQLALAVALATCAQPGDTILAESLTYAGLKSQAQLLGIRVQPIEFDAGGIVAEELESACRTGSVKAVYCQPNAQNPIGTSLDNERRRAIAEAARQCDISIVEDDTYSFAARDEARPIASFAPERTLYITTLTKCLLAGLRVGYLVTPEGSSATHERALMNSGALGAMPAAISVELASHWIENGAAERIASAKRDEARARQQLARKLLGPFESPTCPESPHLWLPLPEPWRAADFVARARRAGVAVSSPEAFAIGRAAAPHAVRICLSTPETREELASGLQRLATILASSPAPTAAIV